MATTFTLPKTLNLTSAATTSGSPNLTVLASAAGSWAIVIGTVVAHANIPVGTTIIGFNSTTQVVMSANATATGSGLTVAATNPGSFNLDKISTVMKTGNDVYNISGPTLVIDSHSRYGVNQATNYPIGAITLSSTLGGKVEINSTKVRLIQYTGGSGNVPALDTDIYQGGATGKLLGVYSALNVAPTDAGAGMPATGFILIRQWNSSPYASGALSGITATSSGADRPGWLEIVGVDAGAITVYRLNEFKALGDNFDFLGVTTDGTRTTQYQIPTNGSSIWVPGVEVSLSAPVSATYTWSGGIVTISMPGHTFEAGDHVEINFTSGSLSVKGDYEVYSVSTESFNFDLPGSGTGGNCTVTEYEFYPSAGTQTALDTKIATDSIRGRWCWITTTGLVSFGYDGTNTSGGYCPPSGRLLRVPNIFFQCCAAATPTANIVPHATLATRMEFAVTGGAALVLDKISINWYLNLNQAFSVDIKNTFTFDNFTLTECASPVNIYNVGVGQSAALSNYGLLLSLLFAGGVFTKCVWTRCNLSSSGNYITSIADITGFTFKKERTHQIYGNRGHASTGAHSISRAVNTNYYKPTVGGGQVLLTTCVGMNFDKITYYDHPATTTPVTIPQYVINLTAVCSNIKIDGIDFGGLWLVQPYSGILYAAVGSNNIKLRNLGTYDSPLDLGGPRVDDVSWTRSGTTVTLTAPNHGLKVNDKFYVPVCSAPSTTITLSSKTVATVVNVNTLTFVGLNAGPTSGTLSYFPTMCGNLFVLASGANNILVQRCYVPHTYTNLFSGDNSCKNVRIDNVISDYLNIFLTAILNLTIHSVSGSPSLAAQTSVYGTHRIDAFNADVTTNLTGLSWSRVTTVCTVTCADHKLRTGLLINVVESDNIAAIKLGTYSVTVLTSSTFTFACVSSGSTSGTLSIRTVVDKIALLMNEPTVDTTDQVSSMTGTAAFTSAGGLVLPTIGDSIVFESPSWRYGFTGFPAAPVVMGGATISNFRIEYQLDKNTGDGYGSWHNMYYPRAGGSGSSGAYTFNVTDATGVEIGNYVLGTGIGGLAKVTNINGNTITVDTPNTATVSSTITFYAHQRNEVLSGLGFKFKIRITSVATYATAITSLSIYADSDDTSRNKLYPLDSNIITFNGLPVGCDIVVLVAGTSTILDQKDSLSGTTYAFEYSGAQDIDVGFIKPGYIPFYLRNLSLTTTDSSIPITLTPDRNYT